MVPKTWAALSDAMDAGCGHAARRAAEIICEDAAGGGPVSHEGQQGRIAEAIRQEVLNAILERFDITDPEGA